jgi:exosortase F-associated protein
MIMYGSITLFGIHFTFKNKQYNRYTLLIFLSLFVLSGLVYVSGNHLLSADRAYTISRQIMGWLQSPIIAMILLPAFYLSEKK